jgi:hypothetical protein
MTTSALAGSSAGLGAKTGAVSFQYESSFIELQLLV